MNKGFENLKKDIPLPRISQKRLNKLKKRRCGRAVDCISLEN